METQTLLSPENHGIQRAGRSAKVELREITLRELGHMYADFTMDEKVYFLLRLSDVGVQRTALWGDDSDVGELVMRARDAGSRSRSSSSGRRISKKRRARRSRRPKAAGLGSVLLAVAARTSRQWVGRTSR